MTVLRVFTQIGAATPGPSAHRSAPAPMQHLPEGSGGGHPVLAMRPSPEPPKDAA